MDLSPRNSQSLLASLSAAQAAFARGSFGAALNELRAFQNKVSAQILPLKPAEAAALLRAAQVIMDALRASPGATAVAGAELRTARDQITSVTRQANGHVRVKFEGAPGLAHLIQTSTNLMDWETVGVGTEVSERSFEFEDANAAPRATRFYRTVQSW